MARAALGVIPEMKLVTKFWMMGRRETTTGMKSLQYVLQMTASVWMPFNQTCEEESVDANFDSFKTVPWDAGGTQRDEVQESMCRTRVHNIDGWASKNTECVFPTKMWLAMLTPGEDDASYRDTLDKLHETMCRAMVHNIDGLTTRNTECAFTTNILLATNCPRLKMTPGEDDASHRCTWIGGDLQDTVAISNGHTGTKDVDIFCHSAICVEVDIPADMDRTAVELSDVTILRRRSPQGQDSAEHQEGCIDISNTAVEFNDGVFRRLRLPWTEVLAEGMEEKCIIPRTDTVSSEQEDRTFCRPKPPWRVAFTEQDMNCSDIRGNSAVPEPPSKFTTEQNNHDGFRWLDT